FGILLTAACVACSEKGVSAREEAVGVGARRLVHHLDQSTDRVTRLAAPQAQVGETLIPKREVRIRLHGGVIARLCNLPLLPRLGFLGARIPVRGALASGRRVPGAGREIDAYLEAIAFERGDRTLDRRTAGCLHTHEIVPALRQRFHYRRGPNA